MERHLDIEISKLKDKLLTMAGHVESSIDNSVKALKERNAQLAQKIVEDDAIINRLEVEVEDQILTIMARQQPVAADLRLMLASVKLNSDLERMGDHAANIAQSALNIMSYPELKPLIDIPAMANTVQAMVKDSLDSFVQMDVQKARAVCVQDDVVDAFEDQIIRELLTYMMGDPRVITHALELSLVARNLERIADLSTNIGEEVIFIVEAKSIKHNFEDVHLKS